jgi:glycosyltransferase involved in cell wall biosynthesis
VDDTCLVVPCYNEQHRLDVGAFEGFAQRNPDVSFCFVNDGSRDRTGEILDGLQRRRSANVLVITLPSNRGKAEAVRQGMIRARAWKAFAYVGYWDADLATPLEQLRLMRTLADGRPGCLMVLGSRILRLGADIRRRAIRHYPGRVFATCASLVLDLPVYDTQCGAKLVRADILPHLFEQPFDSRWLFDVEVLARLRELVGRQALLDHVIEAPLGAWHDKRGSNLTWRAILAAPFELWTIHRRYNRAAPRPRAV